MRNAFPGGSLRFELYVSHNAAQLVQPLNEFLLLDGSHQRFMGGMTVLLGFRIESALFRDRFMVFTHLPVVFG